MGRFILAAVLISTLTAGTEVVRAAGPHAAKPLKQGFAVFYSPGVMERVAAHRGLTKPPIAEGMAAVTDCSQIGKIAFASINGGLVERYLIVDCSHPRDVARHIAQGLVIEVDYQSAVRNNFHRDGKAPALLWAIGSLNLGKGN
ncbi:MAG TPA: hypothetical protein VJ183_09495 [Chloroflexia bacterium]|nr:hypothetical protein [Chloroflexia bacterium]